MGDVASGGEGGANCNILTQEHNTHRNRPSEDRTRHKLNDLNVSYPLKGFDSRCIEQSLISPQSHFAQYGWGTPVNLFHRGLS